MKVTPKGNAKVILGVFLANYALTQLKFWECQMVVIPVSKGETQSFLVSQVDVCAERVKTLFIKRSLYFAPELKPDFDWCAYWVSNEGFFLAPKNPKNVKLVMRTMVKSPIERMIPVQDFGVIMTLFSFRKYARQEHALNQRQMELMRLKYHLLIDYAYELGHKELLVNAKIVPFKK